MTEIRNVSIIEEFQKQNIKASYYLPLQYIVQQLQIVELRFKAQGVIGNQNRFTKINRDVMGENKNQLHFDKFDVDMFTMAIYDTDVQENYTKDQGNIK